MGGSLYAGATQELPTAAEGDRLGSSVDQQSVHRRRETQWQLSTQTQGWSCRHNANVPQPCVRCGPNVIQATWNAIGLQGGRI